jgi:ABC-type multidrug transport system fused ATPase/permease subunit
MNTFRKLLSLLNTQQRKRAYLLLIMLIIMAFMDMIGVASILPFVAVLTNPSLVETNYILSSMFVFLSSFGLNNHQEFIVFLGLLVFLLLIVSLTFKAITTYVQVRFVQMCEYNLGKKLVESYLHQPYSWFLNRHSADLGKTILSEVGSVTSGGLKPFMELIAKSLVAISLIILLIIADPAIALIVGFSLTSIYGIIFFFIRKYINIIGEQRLKNNQIRFTTISEAFGAAKEVKVGGLEEAYVKLFSNAAKIVALTKSSSQAISQLPRFILEAIAMGGILLITLYITSKTGSVNNALPLISVYVFAGYRLIPALQQIYAAIAQLAFIEPSLDRLINDLKSLKPFNKSKDIEILSFNNSIVLRNINYSYPNVSKATLKDINLVIPAKSKIGFIGHTGSGKTTVVDIILGLLEPKKGTLEIDQNIITSKNLRSWQKLIGYVPQHIYLSDDTVAANIAFGKDSENINQEAVEKASKIANLHQFVIEELPNKYQTTIGERGVRLSGGQRQRIGIARALYNNPKLLILDEATSALDNQTEKVVMEAINNLNEDTTLILIAHRLNTVKKCDKIFLLEKGQLKNEGKFHELMDINENFLKTANSQ